MVSKTLLRLSILVFCLILVSACGYMKDMKEKLNPHEAPVNARTATPASPTDGNENPADESSKKDLNDGNSTNKGDDANAANNKKSKGPSQSDLSSEQSTNNQISSKGSTKQ